MTNIDTPQKKVEKNFRAEKTDENDNIRGSVVRSQVGLKIVIPHSAGSGIVSEKRLKLDRFDMTIAKRGDVASPMPLADRLHFGRIGGQFAAVADGNVLEIDRA